VTDDLLLAEPAPAATRKMIRRPYSRLTKRERSVTEALDRKAIPGLPWAAAKLDIEFAVRNPDVWRDLGEDEAIDLLRRHHQGVWDGSAARGTAVHEVVDGFAQGVDVNIWDIVCELAETEPKARGWRGREREVLDELDPYIEGAYQWFEDFDPQIGASEECVRTPGVYIGQRDDSRVSVRGQDGLGLLDWKTTSHTEPNKGVYPDSWILQLTAYDRAAEVVEYRYDPNGRIVEAGTRPNERHDWCAIVHLRGVEVDSGRMYEMFEVPTCDADYAAFLHLAGFNTWAIGAEGIELRTMTP
jgi:hypothetical protein